jgi:cytoskeleton protein RodZ
VSSNSDQLVKLAEIGEQLKRQREERSIPLNQVTSQTLISERHLKAIEEGNLSSLPEPIYVQGFIRKYGNVVGLSGLAEEFPVNREPLNHKEWPKTSTAELRPFHLYGLYLVVITGAISTLAVLFNPARTAKIDDRNTNISEIAQIDQQIDQQEVDKQSPAQPSNDQPTSNPPAQASLDPAIESDPAQVEQSNLNNPSVASSETSDPANTNNPAASDLEQQIAASTTEPSSIPQTTSPNNNNSQSFGSLNEWINQVADSSEFDFNQNKPVNVGLQMNGQSWIRVVADGSTVYEGVMPEGASQAWSANTDIVVRAGNAGAVTIVYNNQPAKTMGSDGEVVEWSFDKDLGIDYGYSAADAGYANQYTYNYMHGNW